MKVLVVKTSSMGDLVHCLPAVTDIARHLPDVTIDWLAEEAFAEIAELHPAVNRVITCAARRWKKSLIQPASWREFFAVRATIKAQSYDIVIDFQGLLKSAQWLKASAGVAHGYDRSSAREPLASLLYQVCHQISPGLHAVERNRLLAASVFGYSPERVDFGLEVVRKRKKQVVFVHGSSRADKCLEIAHWQRLAKLFVDCGFDLLVPWHGAAEKANAEAITAVAGRQLDAMSIGQLATVIAQSQLVIGVDSGLVHLAAALATPTVALYLVTDPSLVGVYGSRSVNLTRVVPAHQHQGLELVADDLDDMNRVFELALPLAAVEK